MPSLNENAQTWSTQWDWSDAGEQWSRWWGDTPSMWHGVLLPRIHPMVPAGTILEIAPGYGRWTQYLHGLCDELIVVDMTEKCIAACRERFAAADNIAYHVNDGRSLAMVDDRSVDFVFSFDSLVHAEPGVIGAYLHQLADKLTPDGVGFLHHSNAGSFKPLAALSRRVPDHLFNAFVRRGIALNLTAWRDTLMSAAIFREQCAQAGLACVTQELISWEHGGYLIDCLSVIAARGSRWDRETRLVRNPMFVAEARRMRRLYSASSFSRPTP